MSTRKAWTDEDVLVESERWVHVPRGGILVRDERRLLVHLPERWSTSRVWRSWVANEAQATDLIEETLEEVRAAGATRLVWHTGDRVAPPFMDACLVRYGFERTEELEVLAMDMGEGAEPVPPRLGANADVRVEIARDAEALREACRVDSEVFSAPVPSEEEIAEYGAEIGKLERLEREGTCGEDSLVLRFVARVDDDGCDAGGYEGRVVASAGAQIVGATVRLWGAGTVEGFRGRGAYRTLVVERCRLAQAFGATLALTKANVGTSGPILVRAGFRRVATERRYVLKVS